jgi:hypothetical protein
MEGTAAVAQVADDFRTYEPADAGGAIDEPDRRGEAPKCLQHCRRL